MASATSADQSTTAPPEPDAAAVGPAGHSTAATTSSSSSSSSTTTATTPPSEPDANAATPAGHPSATSTPTLAAIAPVGHPTTSSNIGPIKPTKRPKRKRQPKNNKHKMITGYIIYASEIRKEVIKKYPEKDFGDISKLVGIEWKNLPQETKVAYEKRAQEQNNVSRMLNEKAEAALELMKLADTAVARELGQQQHHPHHHQTHQQQHHQHHQPQPHQLQIQQHSNRPPLTAHHQEQHAQHQLQPAIQAQLEACASESFHNSHQSHQLSQQQVANLMAEQHHHHHHQQQHQQHKHHQQSPLPSNDACNTSITGLNCNSSQNNVDLNNNSSNNNNAALGLERSFVAQHQDLSFVHQQSQPQQLITPSYPTAQFAQDFYYNYGQPPTMPIPYMNQSTPILARSINDNHNVALSQPPPLQSQQQQPQPLQIIQNQQQQPITMVQYCNGSCCFATGSRSYPTAITPSQSPAPSYQYPPLPASAPLQSRRNNIVYRKPSLVRLRPKDASTQTDPVKWADKVTTEQPKKTLKFSQKFIDYLNCSSNMPHQMLVSDTIDEKIV